MKGYLTEPCGPKTASEPARASFSPVRFRRGVAFAAAALTCALGCTATITDDRGSNAGAPNGASGGSNVASGGSNASSGGKGTVGNGGTGPGGSAGGTTNNANGGSTSPSAGTTSTDPPPVGGELSNCATPGPQLIRRLNKEQFRNTLVAAFNNDQSVPQTDVIANPYDLYFHVDADSQVIRDLDAGLLMDYADEVADWAVTNNKLGTFNSCTTVDDNCAKNFISAAALKLMREPLPNDRLQAYITAFKTETAFKDAATLVLSAMIQSPYTLYRREIGTSDSGAFKLSQYDIASELAYFLTDSPPDQQLLADAQANKLTTQAAIDSHAARLLQTPAAKAAMKRFVEGWLEVEKLRVKTKETKVYDLTMDMREAMIAETTDTFVDAFNNGGDVAKLFTTQDTFVNQSLAQFYGLNGGGSTSTKVSLAGTKRATGLLGNAAFLTAHAQPENSSPTQRGIVVRGRLLCQAIPPVPQGLNTALAAPGVAKTNRERYAMHSQNQPCNGCHKVLDPAGLVFENYDGFGRYRDNENGVAIDASGGLVGIPDGDITLNGVQSLNDFLSKSDTVRACLVRYWSYYAHGRDNWTDKKCNDDSVRREAAANGYTLKSVLMGILHAPSFTRRVKSL
ncbi:MAG TPA: DUF1592 domain-containing protein [Polyangiaceae bacterium]|nr:DUF1592 domain-containing protein [Polyangiaceae bacterium]